MYVRICIRGQVAPPSWGCKFRHGKKLEVKYRVSTMECASVAGGIENFSKVSYGKDAVPFHQDAIVADLQRHKLYASADEALLSRPVFIDLAKARVCEQLHGAYLEVAHITASDLHASWLSVAIEGEAADIESALLRSKTEQRFVLLWIAWSLAVQLCRSAPMAHAPVLVFGGYPTLVHLLGGRATEVERARQLDQALLFANAIGALSLGSSKFTWADIWDCFVIVSKPPFDERGTMRPYTCTCWAQQPHHVLIHNHHQHAFVLGLN
jgi:hypothetical protein